MDNIVIGGGDWASFERFEEAHAAVRRRWARDCAQADTAFYEQVNLPRGKTQYRWRGDELEEL